MIDVTLAILAAFVWGWSVVFARKGLEESISFPPH